MGARNSAAKEIDLGNGFGDVAVRANGIRVELHADGSVAAYTRSDVDAYTNGAVRLHTPSNALIGEVVVTSWPLPPLDKQVQIRDTAFGRFHSIAK